MSIVINGENDCGKAGFEGPIRVRKVSSVKAEVLTEYNKDLITASWFSDWDKLDTVPYILVNPETDDCYPCTMEEFAAAYKRVSGTGRFAKPSAQDPNPRYLVPDGVAVTINTLEGSQDLIGPFYVVIDSTDNPYSNSMDWASANLEILED